MVDEHLQHPPGDAGINVFAGNNRLEILREIGAVGMAVVYEVTGSQREARIALGWPGEWCAWGRPATPTTSRSRST